MSATPTKKRTPSATTIKVNAFRKVQTLRDEIRRREAAEAKRLSRYTKGIGEKKAALKEAQGTFEKLTGNTNA